MVFVKSARIGTAAIPAHFEPLLGLLGRVGDVRSMYLHAAGTVVRSECGLSGFGISWWQRFPVVCDVVQDKAVVALTIPGCGNVTLSF